MLFQRTTKSNEWKRTFSLCLYVNFNYHIYSHLLYERLPVAVVVTIETYLTIACTFTFSYTLFPCILFPIWHFSLSRESCYIIRICTQYLDKRLYAMHGWEENHKINCIWVDSKRHTSIIGYFAFKITHWKIRERINIPNKTHATIFRQYHLRIKEKNIYRKVTAATRDLVNP